MSPLSLIPPSLFDRRMLLAAPLAYLALVRLLRYQRRAYHARLLAKNNGSTALADMSIETAQQIWMSIGQREFPQFFQLGLSFALFRTYGIPSISKLLAETGRLASRSYIDQRLADTVALVIEFTSRPIYGSEWTEAMARLNCIHDHYMAQGRILMDDMRYTLALFALEPPRWVSRHDWRAYSDVELCATGVLWRALGEAMGITWDGLASFDAAKAKEKANRDDVDASAAETAEKPNAWRDGRHFLSELAAWTEEYEATHMVATDDNAAVARHTADQLLSTLPLPTQSMRAGALSFLSALMDERLRRSVRFPAASLRTRGIFATVLGIRRFCIKYLMLPRPSFLRVQSSSGDRNEAGRVFLTYYTRSPFYVRPTLVNRWGPIALLKRLRGLPVPGPTQYKPEGYVPKEVGPPIAKDGQQDMEQTVQQRVERLKRCPFGGGEQSTKSVEVDARGEAEGATKCPL